MCSGHFYLCSHVQSPSSSVPVVGALTTAERTAHADAEVIKEERMFARRIVHTLCGVVLLGVLATSSTGAFGNADRTTHFTFSRAVQLPGVTLPAGTYTFAVANPQGSADIVKVTSRDGSKL